MKKFTSLPKEMQTDIVKPYYDIVRKKRLSLFFIRFFDILISLIGLIILSPIFIILSIAIKLSSGGSVFYKQVRMTRYLKEFNIIKFRTMIADADKLGAFVTVSNDPRVTKIGRFMRKTKLDEIPQLFNVLRGDMTFVGTRPSVTRYVDEYTPEYYATLLLPAGVTSMTSVKYRDEGSLLKGAKDVDKLYLDEILPAKMKINLSEIKHTGVFYNLWVIIYTMLKVIF